jgi:hypothetical protein
MEHLIFRYFNKYNISQSNIKNSYTVLTEARESTDPNIFNFEIDVSLIKDIPIDQITL